MRQNIMCSCICCFSLIKSISCTISTLLNDIKRVVELVIDIVRGIRD